MANITIQEVVDKRYYKINFNDYADSLGIETRFFWPESLEFIDVDGHVTISFNSKNQDMFLSFEEGVDKVLIVDSVYGIAPTDNNHLATLIADLKG